MTRLVFLKNESGTVYTTSCFIARDKLISGNVFLIDNGWAYNVIDLGSGTVLTAGSTKTISQSKKLIKEQIKRLGVNFEDEVRKKVK